MFFFLSLTDVDREEIILFIPKHVDAQCRVLPFKFLYVYNFHRKINTTDIQLLPERFVVMAKGGFFLPAG